MQRKEILKSREMIFDQTTKLSFTKLIDRAGESSAQ